MPCRFKMNTPIILSLFTDRELKINFGNTFKSVKCAIKVIHILREHYSEQASIY